MFLLAGLFQYLGDKQQKQYTPSRQAKTDCKADGRQIFTTCFNAGADLKSISSSRTGPKSGHIHRHKQSAVLFRLIVFLLHVLPLRAVNVDVRVGGLAATPPGASSGAKPSGIREASVPELERADPTRIAKRTYRRAYARAVRQGGSYYQGRWRELSWYQKTKIQPVCVPRTRQVRSAAGHHIRVCTWNAGGLTRPTFQELETWIRDRGIDVMFIQETKWADEYCWDNPEYSYVHSAGTQKVDKVGGVLTIVSTRLAKSSDIQFHHVWAGRLLHVRVPAGGSSIDLLNVYQYSANEKPETLHRRQQFLQRLQKCLAGLPRRHSLIMSGDMNTSCESTPHVCGPHVLPIREYHKQDYRDFLHICEALSLSLLNTWAKPPNGQLATFSFGALASQIDYIIVRRHQATPEAKQASVITDFPVAGWREGAKHYPVIASVPVPKHRWPPRGAATAQRPDLDAVLEDLRLRDPPDRLQLLRSEVTSSLKASDDFDRVMMQAALHHYPPRPRPDKPPTQPADQQCSTHVATLSTDAITSFRHAGGGAGMENLGQILASARYPQTARKCKRQGQTGRPTSTSPAGRNWRKHARAVGSGQATCS